MHGVVFSLEQVPPIPTLQHGPHPLHRFLGFDQDRHITSLCLRDPLDMREMPPNGNAYVSANCVRGVKKVRLPCLITTRTSLPDYNVHERPSFGGCT